MQQAFDRDRLVGIVQKASNDVFGTMLGIDLNPLPAYSESEPPTATAGILSLIGFTGTWIGTGSLCCNATMGCRIADALLMSEHPAVDEEVLDAVAEMTNMILGNVKTEIEEESGPMALSIPTVIFGRNFVKRSLGKREWTIVPFESRGERFEVQICMAPNPEPLLQKPKAAETYGVHV